MRRNAQLKIALDLSVGRERFNCQEKIRSQGGELRPGVSHLRNTDAGQKLLLPQKPLPCGWFVAQL